MKVKIENIEIRGVEVKESKKDSSQYMIVRFEDETGTPTEIVDRDMARRAYYQRGQVGDIIADLRMGRQFTSLTVVDFRQHAGSVTA